MLSKFEFKIDNYTRKKIGCTHSTNILPHHLSYLDGHFESFIWTLEFIYQPKSLLLSLL